MPSKVGQEEAAGDAEGRGVGMISGVGTAFGTTTAMGEASGAAPVGRISRVHPPMESNDNVIPPATPIQDWLMTEALPILEETSIKYL
jgi:hypothetical protein